MHQLLAEQYVASIKRRASQGDCPTEAPLSVETLEDLVLTLDALSSLPAQAEGVSAAAWKCEFFRADPSPRWWPEVWLSDPREFYGDTLVRDVKPLYLAPSQPAAVGVTDEMVEAIVQAVRPYTHRTLFLEEHRDLVRAALRSTP